MTDFAGPDGGKLAVAFGVGCSSAWVFIRNLVMKPAIKSCHERLSDLEERLSEYRERERVKDARIATLETTLLLHGPQDLRKAMQAALSEARVEIDTKAQKV